MAFGKSAKHREMKIMSFILENGQYCLDENECPDSFDMKADYVAAMDLVMDDVLYAERSENGGFCYKLSTRAKEELLTHSISFF